MTVDPVDRARLPRGTAWTRGSGDVRAARTAFLRGQNLTTIRRSQRVLGVLEVSGSIEVGAGGFETFGETRIFGMRVRRTKYLSVPWPEVQKVEIDRSNPAIALVQPVRPGYFIQPIKSKGALRIRPRVNADGWLATNWGTPERANDFVRACEEWMNEKTAE